MYPVNIRPRFSSDIVVGMGEVAGLDNDMLSGSAMMSGLGVIGKKKRKKTRGVPTAMTTIPVAVASTVTGEDGAAQPQVRLRARQAAAVRKLTAKQQAQVALAAQKAALRASYLSQLQVLASAAGYPPGEVAALLARGFGRATRVLKKLGTLRSRKDIKAYKKSLKSLQEGGALPIDADAAASAATGLPPETSAAGAMMPSASYAEQEEGLPAYAQQSVEAAAQAVQPSYQLPYDAGVVAPSASDEDIVSPEEVEGAVIDLSSQPRTGIPSAALPDEDFDEQTGSPADEEVIESPVEEGEYSRGSLDGEVVTPGLPSMGQAGSARNITELISEEAGREDALTLELSKARYPSMLVEEEQVGWPSKVGEGTTEDGGWYGSDPALTSPEEINGSSTLMSPQRMHRHMRKLEAAASANLTAGVEEEIPVIEQRERRKRVAVKEAAALTRYVVGKHRRNGRVSGSFGLGATPFGAQWAVQNALNSITERENQLMAISPERLESIRRLNATTYAQIEESRKILEGPSVAITDELAAVAKFTVAAATYKGSLDTALKASEPAKPKKPKPATIPAALPGAIKDTLFSKYGLLIVGGGVVLVGGLLVVNMLMKRRS